MSEWKAGDVPPYMTEEVTYKRGRQVGRTLTDLVDISAIARRLNVPKDTVNKWRYRNIFPPPDYALDVGPVWEWSTVEKWATETGRLKHV